jgi:hypothetical protein
VKKIKAYKIDVEKQDVYEVEISDISDQNTDEENDTQLDQIYKLIGCRCIGVGGYFDTGAGNERDVIYVDDEGRLRDEKTIPGFFQMGEGQEVIVGNGLVFGSKEGNDVSPLTPLHNVKRVVKFFKVGEILKPEPYSVFKFLDDSLPYDEARKQAQAEIDEEIARNRLRSVPNHLSQAKFGVGKKEPAILCPDCLSGKHKPHEDE